MLVPQEFIRLERDKAPLPPELMREFVQGVTDGSVSDAQIAAFCMAVLLNGMSIEETAALTMAMAESGTRLNWGDLKGKIVDKHSTGGVGDKVSLMLAPMVAACGLYVPMIAGRGLGHTGGTIDKLEAIPGFNTQLPIAEFQTTVRRLGCAIIGQTGEFAPADKRLYAVRDVTATVESIQLITASILSKKLAAGLDALVLDVKCGNGAFMDDRTKAEALAQSLKTVAEAAGLKLTPIITDMNQVLGSSAGNTVEVIEAIEYLTGAKREPRLHEITLQLTAEMLVMGGAAKDGTQARTLLQASLDNGKAAEIFAQMVAAQGGPKEILSQPQKILGTAPVVKDIIADRSGTLQAMRTRDIGILLVKLKAGRALVGEAIDPQIGLTEIAPLGTICEAGKTVLAKIHLRNESDFDFAHKAYLECLTIE